MPLACIHASECLISTFPRHRSVSLSFSTGFGSTGWISFRHYRCTTSSRYTQAQSVMIAMASHRPVSQALLAVAASFFWHLILNGLVSKSQHQRAAWIKSSLIKLWGEKSGKKNVFPWLPLRFLSAIVSRYLFTLWEGCREKCVSSPTCHLWSVANSTGNQLEKKNKSRRKPWYQVGCFVFFLLFFCFFARMRECFLAQPPLCWCRLRRRSCKPANSSGRQNRMTKVFAFISLVLAEFFFPCQNVNEAIT